MTDTAVDNSKVMKALRSIERARKTCVKRTAAEISANIRYGVRLNGRLVHSNSDYLITLFWHDRRLHSEVWHSHPDRYEEIVMIRGAIEVRIKGQADKKVEAPDSLLVPMGVAHSLKSVAPGTKGCSILISEDRGL